MRSAARSLVQGLVILACASSASAQDLPVIKWADWASYGTAVVNPAVAAYKALKSDNPKCKIGQLVISEVIGNGVSLGVKRWRHGEPEAVRPCAGCEPDGFPSGHTTNGTIGALENGWAVGASFAIGTGALRRIANRHFIRWQVAAGWLLGIASDWAGHYFLKCDGA